MRCYITRRTNGRLEWEGAGAKPLWWRQEHRPFQALGRVRVQVTRKRPAGRSGGREFVSLCAVSLSFLRPPPTL